MIEPFILHAIIAGIGVALTVGPLGCFVVWRNMSYFGDSLAHSALLGIALGLALGINTTGSLLVVCLAFALLLVTLQRRKGLGTDTLLGILAHAALSFGIIAISLIGNPQFDLYAYLFGDILTVTTSELTWIYAGGTCVLLVLARLWSPLLLMTIQPDIAHAEGVRNERLQLTLVIMLTLVVAIAIHIVGSLLITSLLIIPAATARLWAKSPEAMAWGASLIGSFCVVAGVMGSLHWDIPSGPAIIATNVVLFMFILPLRSVCAHLYRRSATSPLKSTKI